MGGGRLWGNELGCAFCMNAWLPLKADSRSGMTNSKAEQIRGFFAALRMTAGGVRRIIVGEVWL